VLLKTLYVTSLRFPFVCLANKSRKVDIACLVCANPLLCAQLKVMKTLCKRHPKRFTGMFADGRIENV
jgi:hypothetical protein